MHTWHEWKILVNEAERAKSDAPEVQTILEIDKILRHFLEHTEYSAMTNKLTGTDRQELNDTKIIRRLDAILGAADFLRENPKITKSTYSCR